MSKWKQVKLVGKTSRDYGTYVKYSLKKKKKKSRILQNLDMIETGVTLSRTKNLQITTFNYLNSYYSNDYFYILFKLMNFICSHTFFCLK